MSFIAFIEYYDVFVNALLAGFLIVLASAPLGSVLTLKKMTLVGEAINHSLLPGFALSFMMFGLSTVGLFWGGFVAGLFVIALLSLAKPNHAVKDDGIMTVTYLSFSALGLILLLRAGSSVDLTHMLVGNILLIDRIWLLVLLFSCIIIRYVFYRIKDRLILLLVDPEFARFKGISSTPIKSIFYFLVLWVLVLSFYSVGSLLSLGFLMIPSLIARLTSKTFDQQVRRAVISGAMIVILGIVISFFLNIATGPLMVFIGGVLFLIVSIFKPRHLIGIILVTFLLGHSNAQAQILVSVPFIKLYIKDISVVINKNIKIETLIPVGQSVHNYQVLPNDIGRIKSSEYFIFVGNSLDYSLQEQVKKLNPTIISVPLLSEQDKDDIHSWMSPLNYESIIEKLVSFSKEKRLSSDIYLTQNIKEKKIKNVKSLVEEFKKQMSKIDKREIIVSHNSFQFISKLAPILILSPSFNISPTESIKFKSKIMNQKIPILKEVGYLDFTFESLIKSAHRTYSAELLGDVFDKDQIEAMSYTEWLASNFSTIVKVLVGQEFRSNPTPKR